MAVDSAISQSSNGHVKEPVSAKDSLPGTTFPQHVKDLTTNDSPPRPISKPGPTINGKATTITIFHPSQLVDSPLIPLHRSVVNKAFSQSHISKGSLPGDIDRLQGPVQFLEELGNTPGTFTVIVYHEQPLQVLATASSKRYTGPPKVIAGYDSTRLETFKRNVEKSKDFDQWELNMMVVDPEVQNQGLASLMIRLVEGEIRRRHVSMPPDQGGELEHANGNGAVAANPMGLMMILTTIKEINEVFYKKKGFTKDYETAWPPGYLRSPEGFSVIHMSKQLE